MSNKKKISLIIPIAAVLAVIITVVVLTLLGIIRWSRFDVKFTDEGIKIYNESDIIFGYVDANVFEGTSESNSKDYQEMLEKDHLGGYFPYFGNPLTLSEFGMVKNWSNEDSKKNEPIYQSINDPLYAYATDLAFCYDNLVDMQYSVSNDGKTLTIVFDCKAFPNGLNSAPESIGHTFIYNIEDVSLNILPVLDENSVKLVDPLYLKYYGASYEDIRNSY